jgi:hypothetical protein
MCACVCVCLGGGHMCRSIIVVSTVIKGVYRAYFDIHTILIRYVV